MDVESLVPSSVLSTTQAYQPEYANRTPALKARSLPLSGMYQYRQASFVLDKIFLSMAKRWPSVTHGIVEGERTMVCIGLRDPEGLTVNGQLIRFPAITVGRIGAEYRVAEATPWTSVIVMFPTHTLDRDWPESGLTHRIVQVDELPLMAVRRLMWDIFRVASFAPERLSIPGVVQGMVDSIYVAFDQAFLSAKPVALAGALARHAQIARRVDEFIKQNVHRPIYSNDIAKELNLTTRTLHTAIQTCNGMSLHRYLRLQRLWMVRWSLLEAEPGTLIKQIALEHGFWHLGRFSADYQRQFGESPSSTVQRSARRY